MTAPITLETWRAMSKHAKLAHMREQQYELDTEIDALEREIALRYIRVATRVIGEDGMENLRRAWERVANQGQL